jgi:hypothetical protein
MSDDRTWTWYCGILAGYGECIWQQLVSEHTTLRYIAKILRGPQGERLMRLPFGADKHAETMYSNRDSIVFYAPADKHASDEVLALYDLNKIISASAADIGKAPKLSLVK